MIFQVVLGASMCTGIYTAWVLYRRAPGTLRTGQNGLLATAALRVMAPGMIPLFGGLPSEMTNELVKEWIVTAALALVITASWYLYLCRSKAVREIYAGADVS